MRRAVPTRQPLPTRSLHRRAERNIANADPAPPPGRVEGSKPAPYITGETGIPICPDVTPAVMLLLLPRARRRRTSASRSPPSEVSRSSRRSGQAGSAEVTEVAVCLSCPRCPMAPGMAICYPQDATVNSTGKAPGGHVHDSCQVRYGASSGEIGTETEPEPSVCHTDPSSCSCLSLNGTSSTTDHSPTLHFHWPLVDPQGVHHWGRLAGNARQ